MVIGKVHTLLERYGTGYWVLGMVWFGLESLLQEDMMYCCSSLFFSLFYMTKHIK